MLHKTIKLRKYSDNRGDLIPLEFDSSFENNDIPFSVNRAYFIVDPTSDSVRGCHAHKTGEQVIICLKGSFVLYLDDGKGNTDNILLNDRTEAIYINGFIWRELKEFSDNCVIAVFSSKHYDKNDYIFSYDDFKDSV